MSYILDALKKSDLERQQQQGPVLARVQHQQFFVPRRRIGWLGGLVGVTVGLLVLAAAVTALAYRNGYVQFDPPAMVAARPDSVPGDAVVPEPFAAAPVPEETPVPEEAPAIITPSPSASAPVQLPASPAAQAIPEIWQLPAPSRAAIPAMDFSLHVYSDEPEQRSIIINNRMMREGEFVSPELMLQAITRQGVVMRYRTLYFRVGILEDW